MYSLDSEAVQPYNPTTSVNVAPDSFNVSLARTVLADLQILGAEPGSLREAGEHPRPDLLRLMKGEHHIRPSDACERLVRA